MTDAREIPLIPDQSALLIIDVQNFCAKREGGEFDGLQDAEYDAKFGWFMGQLWSETIPNIKRLQDACNSYSQERHDTSLRTIKGYCRQMTTQDLVDEITGAKKG